MGAQQSRQTLIMHMHMHMHMHLCSSCPCELRSFAPSSIRLLLCNAMLPWQPLFMLNVRFLQDMIPVLLGKFAAPSRLRRNWMVLAVATPAALAAMLYMYRNRCVIYSRGRDEQAACLHLSYLCFFPYCVLVAPFMNDMCPESCGVAFCCSTSAHVHRTSNYGSRFEHRAESVFLFMAYRVGTSADETHVTVTRLEVDSLISSVHGATGAGSRGPCSGYAAAFGSSCANTSRNRFGVSTTSSCTTSP